MARPRLSPNAGVGLGQLVGEGEVVDDDHLHVGQGRCGVGVRRLEVLVEDRLHRLAVQRRAVVEQDVRPQLDGPLGEVLAGGDRLGQVGRHLALGVAAHQRVVDGVGHRGARVGEVAGSGQPAAGLGLEADGDRAAVDGLALVGDVALGAGRLAAGVPLVVAAAAAGRGGQAGHDQQPRREPARQAPSFVRSSQLDSPSGPPGLTGPAPSIVKRVCESGKRDRRYGERSSWTSGQTARRLRSAAQAPGPSVPAAVKWSRRA